MFQINFEEIFNTIRNFFLSTNFYFSVFLFIIFFILVRKVLKIIQWLLGLITSLWFTALVIYFLIQTGFMEKIINFLNMILQFFGL